MDKIKDLKQNLTTFYNPEKETKRTNLINKFRKEIKNSTYVIKSDEIAEKIAQKLKEEGELE